MPRYKPGYSPDGTPKKPQKPSTPSGKKYGPDGTPIPQPKPSGGRYWIPEKTGTERDGTRWVIPGHWSDEREPERKKEEPAFKNSHRCKMNGAFIVLGGYIKIYDDEVPAGMRGHELYLAFGGVGVGGMDGDGILTIDVSSWEEFYNKVHSFAYIAMVPTLDIPTSKLAHTAIVFFDSNSNKIGYAVPDVSGDLGIAGGTVTVKS